MHAPAPNDPVRAIADSIARHAALARVGAPAAVDRAGAAVKLP